MKKSLFIASFLIVQSLSAQHLGQITIDPLDIPEYKPTGEPSVEIDDLKLWFCGDFFVDMPVLVRANKDITGLNLVTSGGYMLNFGRTNEFLVKADTIGDVHEVIFEYFGKTSRHRISYLSDPKVKLKLGGQIVDGPMLSISSAKTDNMVEFVGDYDLEVDISCYPVRPELKVEGQIELSVRGATKDRIEFEPSTSVNIERLLEQATPGSQLVVTQVLCLTEGNMIHYRFSPTFTMILLIN